LDLPLAPWGAHPSAAGPVPATRLHLKGVGDPAFQRREWIVQRVGWGMLGAWVAAAVLGATGPGPCSSRELEAPDASFSVSFDQIVHQHAPTLWRVTAKRGIPALTIADARGLELEALPPSTSQVARDDGARILRFGGAAPSAVELEVVVRDAGWSRRRVQVADGVPLSVGQLVLP